VTEAERYAAGNFLPHLKDRLQRRTIIGLNIMSEQDFINDVGKASIGDDLLGMFETIIVILAASTGFKDVETRA